MNPTLKPPRLYQDDCQHTDEEYLGRAISYGHHTRRDTDSPALVDVYLLINHPGCVEKYAVCLRHSSESGDYTSTNIRSLLSVFENASHTHTINRRRIFTMCAHHLGLDYLYDERDLKVWWNVDGAWRSGPYYSDISEGEKK